ncbi:hypothetical protein KCU64_g8164, partial [Aureobasidium melanogenum]
MSEIIALRTLIMDNMEMLNYPDLKLCRFVLTEDKDNDGSVWHAFLDKPASGPYHSMRGDYKDIMLIGEGYSPTEACEDLLNFTAELLHLSYFDSQNM